MFLLIDNYDSFTYNLVQAFLQLGKKPVVVKNNDPDLPQMALRDDLTMVCLSPGPSNPKNAGYCLEFLNKLPTHIPVLGVCLGHQILGYYAGASVVINNEIVHGKQSDIIHNKSGLFSGLPCPMTVGRYHSLTVLADEVPDKLVVTARTHDNGVMALAYKDRPWAGVQFHPESILTSMGMKMLDNFPSALLSRKEVPAVPLDAAKTLDEEPTVAPIKVSDVLDFLALGQDLTKDVASEIFSKLMSGELSMAQSGALLMGLRNKGETADEVSAAASAVLAKSIQVPRVMGKTIDVVGTGGDSKNSFNCSTATSFFLAAMGHKVLKHGNRSVSSSCGSADVLEKIGVPLATPASEVPATLEKDNFVFLFAPQYHPAFRHVVPVRRELGIRTLFNILGPLVNPANPTHHMIGVANEMQIELVANAFAQIEPDSIGAIVHGRGGYDELTTIGPASIIFIRNGSVAKATLDPTEFGFAPCKEEELAVCGPDEAYDTMKKILSGKGTKAMSDMVALNLGFALYLLDLPEEETIDPQKGYDVERMKRHMEEAKTAVSNGVGAKQLTAYKAQ